MAFLLRRLGFYLAAFIAAATINFFLPRVMPGDPIQIMFAGAGSDLSLENLNALKLTFGFIDAPLWDQYLAYLKSVFTGDLGRSIRFFPLPVTDLLGRALIWTVGLVGIATLVSFTLGTLLGVMAAWRRGTLLDTIVSLTAIFSSSVPAVVVSLLTLFVFGYTLGWFPSGYAADPMLDPAWTWDYISSVLYHGTMPMLTLVIVLTGGFAVTMRNNMINLLGEDYIVMGRAKGLVQHPGHALVRRAQRPAAHGVGPCHLARCGARRLAGHRGGVQLSGHGQHALPGHPRARLSGDPGRAADHDGAPCSPRTSSSI